MNSYILLACRWEDLRWLPLVAVLILGGAGCKTYEQISPTYNLWQKQTQPSFCRPHADPELALFEMPKNRDTLVVYDCGSEQHPGSHRRAYFLEASRTNIAAGRPPQFVNPKLARGLPSIQVIKEYSLEADPDPTNTWARVHADSFTLYRPGEPPEDCRFPVYQDYFPKPDRKGGDWWRIALTPAAVTVDVGFGVLVVGTVTAPYWVPFLAN